MNERAFPAESVEFHNIMQVCSFGPRHLSHRIVHFNIYFSPV